MSEHIIETENLVKRYDGLAAVDGLSIKVKRGEVFGLLGPNGAGKSTSIKMMVGLLKPTSGRTLIDGVEVKANSRVVKEKVGVCPQEVVVWDRLSVYENMRLIGELQNVQKRELASSIDALLSELGLEEKRKARAGTLSGGMKRRLNLAMALVHDPEIVVLDEPSPGLDPQLRLTLWEFIRKIPARGGKTVILTTHMMEEAERLSDRVAIIDRGRLLVVDTPENLRNMLGEGDVIELSFETEPEAKAAEIALRSLPDLLEARSIGNKTWLRMRNAVRQMQSVFRAVETAGVKVEDVKLRKNRLEDVFISLTGRELRE